MPDESSKKKGTAEKGRKRTREGSSQTDEGDASDQHHKHGCKKCLEATNSRLSGIEEKLNTLLAILPELENYKQRITLLEEENKALQTSLENSQAEIEDLRALVDGLNLKQEAANTSSERIEHEIKELHRRHVKLECHSRRGNLKYFGIKERENETNNDTELALREFMRTKLKILPVDEKNIHFYRVHRITSRHSQSNGRSLKPRPIIVRLTDFHQQQLDIIFLQETYSSPESIKRWETEWGGKIVSSHGSSHSRGVMILFKPRLDVDFQKINADNSGRCILAETIIDGTKVVLVNIYAPNDTIQQVVFLRDVSKEFLMPYANDNLVLGGDFNCTISTSDKKGGRPIDSKKASLDELQSLIKTHNLLDSWRFKNRDQPGFTWANPSMKIQCRLDYFFISKQQKDHVKDCKILPTIYSDHSAVALSMSFNESELPRGPGFWKFNNSLLSDTNYVELLTFKIPMFAKKHEQVNDKGLYWEMIKMEIRAFTIAFSKKKAKRKRDEESILLSEMMRLQIKLQASYSDSLKTELERIKFKLSKIAGIKTRGTIVRSRARWYEHGERNSKYFYNLEKRNQKKKHITSLIMKVTKSQTRRTSWRKKNAFSKRFTHQEIWTPTAQLSMSSLK